MSSVRTVPSLPRGRQARSRAARAAVREHALRLFLRDGYAPTTVELIAEVAGISRRTFFRYFPSKEDVVVPHAEDVALRIADAYRGRPVSEPPLASLHAALQPLIADHAHDPVRMRAILRLTADTPELRARNKETQERWARMLAAEVGARHPDRGPIFAEVAAVTALAAMNVGVGQWLARGGDLPRIVDEAFQSQMEALR